MLSSLSQQLVRTNLQRKININNHKIAAHSHSLRDRARERGRGKTTKKAKWELETRLENKREEISSTIIEKKLVVLQFVVTKTKMEQVCIVIVTFFESSSEEEENVLKSKNPQWRKTELKLPNKKIRNP